MNTSPVFDWLANEITTRTGLDALKSRGTLRIALQNGGLEPRTLTKDQAAVVINRLLAHELKLRGHADAASMCMRIEAALRVMLFGKVGPDSAETTFARLGRK